MIGKDSMFTVGFGTIFLYLLSLTLFLLAAFYQNFFVIGVALGALFFVIPSLIIGIMVKMRMET
jgi:hypothetical protein